MKEKLILTIALFVISLSAFSNNNDNSKLEKEIKQILEDARIMLSIEEYDQALMYADSAIVLSEEIDYTYGLGIANLISVKCYYKLGNREKLEEKLYPGILYLQSANLSKELVEIYDIAGLHFQSLDSYELAINYFKKSITVREKLKDKKGLFDTSILTSYLYEKTGDLVNAETYAILSLNHITSKKQEIEVYEWILFLNQKQEDKSGIELTYSKVLTLLEDLDDPLQKILIYNSLGFYYSRHNEYELASKMYKLANNVNIIYSEKESLIKGVIAINDGVAYSNLKLYKKAKDSFILAIDHYAKVNAMDKIAEAYNYLGANYILASQKKLAKNYLLKAENIGLYLNLYKELSITYDLLRMIEEKLGHEEETEKYASLSEEYKKKYDQQNREEKIERLQASLGLILKDQKLADLIVKQREELKILRREAEMQAKKQQEIERKEQELSYLKQQQALQQEKLRNETLQREALLAQIKRSQQEEENEKKAQAILNLEKEKEMQTLQLNEQKAIQREKEKELDLLQKQEALNKASLQKQRLINLSIGLGLVGVVIVALLLIYGLRQRKKSIEQLKDQQNEILTQNEELYQQSEEIKSQRDAIELQSKEVNDLYEDLNKSIEAAETIQFSMLPSDKKMKSLLGEFFVIYKPRDTVSGDFYWLSELKDGVMLVAADCTGHGVPGSLISIIGKHLMDKLVVETPNIRPDQLLDRLHLEIVDFLSQDETGNKFGMDAAALFIRKNENDVTLIHAGAKRNSHYLLPDEDELQLLKRTNKSIGGIQKNKDYIVEEVIVPYGTMIFLTSDGFADQNNKDRKKFTAKKLEELFALYGHKMVEEQKERLLDALADHQESELQRDDIMVIGIKV